MQRNCCAQLSWIFCGWQRTVRRFKRDTGNAVHDNPSLMSFDMNLHRAGDMKRGKRLPQTLSNPATIFQILTATIILWPVTLQHTATACQHWQQLSHYFPTIGFWLKKGLCSPRARQTRSLMARHRDHSAARTRDYKAKNKWSMGTIDILWRWRALWSC